MYISGIMKIADKNKASGRDNELGAKHLMNTAEKQGFVEFGGNNLWELWQNVFWIV